MKRTLNVDLNMLDYDESLMQWPCIYQMMTGWTHRFILDSDGIHEIGERFDDDVKKKIGHWAEDFSKIFTFNTKYRFLFETNFKCIRLIEPLCGLRFVEGSLYYKRYEEFQNVIQKVKLNTPKELKLAVANFLPRPLDVEEIRQLEKLGVHELWFRNIQDPNNTVYVKNLAELKLIS